MSDALTSLAKAERQVDHERAVDQRRELGLKYRENRNLERYLESRVTDAHAARMTPIDIVTLELVERERTEITNTAAAVQERIDRERAQGREARENSGRPWT